MPCPPVGRKTNGNGLSLNTDKGSATIQSPARNIVIFSDGTGQDGGIRPEQRLSNVFKMFRASRVGPDNNIDPSLQVAFYDPGLGTDTSATGMTSVRRSITKMLSSVTGRGITTNIADCYEFIINHHRPGDRIWLFGFSRGAYTIRCVANVLMLCGVPTKARDGPLPRFRSQIRDIADRAVIRIYEHGAGHPRGKYEDERWELAQRFRREHDSGGSDESNAAPYFVGAFDTVASLGAKGPLRIVLATLFMMLIAIFAGGCAWLVHGFVGAPWPWAIGFGGGLVVLIAAWLYLRTALKIMWPPLPGHRFPRLHLAQWSGNNFDKLLSRSVLYARHAIAIDENRADFPRLRWGGGKLVPMPVKIGNDVEPFVQLWFVGNHSDIGGSYNEAESRLSDIALRWMIDEAKSVPHPLLLNEERLQLYPAPDGLQHDEVARMSDTIRGQTPGLFRWLTKKWTWKVQLRDPIPEATLHPSVGQRFALPSVASQAGDGPYRPEALRKHKNFRHLY